jgi:hypothetical protein
MLKSRTNFGRCLTQLSKFFNKYLLILDDVKSVFSMVLITKKSGKQAALTLCLILPYCNFAPVSDVDHESIGFCK